MCISQIAQSVLELDRPNPFKVCHLLDRVLVESLGSFLAVLNLACQSLNLHLKLAHTLASRLVVVDAAEVLDFAAQEPRRAHACAVLGSERVAVGSGFSEVLG